MNIEEHQTTQLPEKIDPEIYVNMAAFFRESIQPGSFVKTAQEFSKEDLHISAVPTRSFTGALGMIPVPGVSKIYEQYAGVLDKVEIGMVEDAYNPCYFNNVLAAFLLEVAFKNKANEVIDVLPKIFQRHFNKFLMPPQPNDLVFPGIEASSKILAEILEKNRSAILVAHSFAQAIDPLGPKYNGVPKPFTVLQGFPGITDSEGNTLGSREIVEQIIELRSNRMHNNVLGLNWDTAHTRRDPMKYEMEKYGVKSIRGFAAESWQEIFQNFFSKEDLVQVVDVQAMSPEELYKTLTGEETELHQMIIKVAETNYRGKWRIEIKLDPKTHILKPELIKNYVYKMRDVIVEAMENAYGSGTW